MLSVYEAKEIGIKACINKIGYEFCKKHADNATAAYGEIDGVVNCFVGVNNEPSKDYDISKIDRLILTHDEDWPYSASCNVDMRNGDVEFLEYNIPE